MVSSDTRLNEFERPRRSLYTSLFTATQVIENVANGLYTDYRHRRVNCTPDHDLSSTALDRYLQYARPSRQNGTIFDMIRSWLRDHEDAQVMFASILMVFGVWWLVRTAIALVFNLISPLLIVIMALICIPQLREPLLGQNYPALANLLRNILLKMAETLKP